MKIKKDDPRILNYVLNEMSASDKMAFELEIKNDIDLQNEIKELKNILGQAKVALDDGHEFKLSKERRQKLFNETIYSQINSGIQIKNWFKSQWIAGGLIATAFTIMIYNQSLHKEVQKSNINVADYTKDSLKKQELGAPTQLNESGPALKSSTNSPAPTERSEGFSEEYESAQIAPSEMKAESEIILDNSLSKTSRGGFGAAGGGAAAVKESNVANDTKDKAEQTNQMEMLADEAVSRETEDAQTAAPAAPTQELTARKREAYPEAAAVSEAPKASVGLMGAGSAAKSSATLSVNEKLSAAKKKATQEKLFILTGFTDNSSFMSELERSRLEAAVNSCNKYFSPKDQKFNMKYNSSLGDVKLDFQASNELLFCLKAKLKDLKWRKNGQFEFIFDKN